MGAEATIAAIDALIERIRENTRQAVVDAQIDVMTAAQRNAPVVTGTLRRSIIPDQPIEVEDEVWRGRVGPTVIYGRIRELGGHIYPKRVRFLRWYGPDGKPVFARHVYQHGRPYLRPAVDEVGPLIREHVIVRMAEAIEGG